MQEYEDSGGLNPPEEDLKNFTENQFSDHLFNIQV